MKVEVKQAYAGYICGKDGKVLLDKNSGQPVSRKKALRFNSKSPKKNVYDLDKKWADFLIDSGRATKAS